MRTPALRLTGAIALLALLATAAVAEDDIEPVAVRVNGTPISAAAVNEVVRGVIKDRGAPPSSEEIGKLSDAALDSLIDLELLYQDAQARGLIASDAQVNVEIERTRKRFATPEQFAAALKQSGMSEAALRADTRKTLTVNRLLTEVVWKDIAISAPDARRFYDENRGEFVRNGTPTPFEQAEPTIVAALREAEQRRRQAEFVAELRRKARLETPTPAP